MPLKTFVKESLSENEQGVYRGEITFHIYDGANCANDFQNFFIQFLRFRKLFHKSFSSDQNRFYEDLLSHLEFEDI